MMTRYTTPEFRPYVTALGQLTLAWNDLQESLAGLFWTAMNRRPPAAGDFVEYTPLMVWHSIKSDRSQRDMLKAALGIDQGKNQRTVYVNEFGRPALSEDAKWIIDRCNELEMDRNNAVHSPLFSTSATKGGLGAAAQYSEPVRPANWQFNPKAIQLSAKQDILLEFRYCRDMAIYLADYAHAIDAALTHPQRPWPKRLKPPVRRQRTSRQGLHRPPHAPQQ
jgi:hypothetical protein